MQPERSKIQRRVPATAINDMGVICEPESREPWFISSAHDAKSLEETLTKFKLMSGSCG